MYDDIVTHQDVVTIFYIFRFVANAQDLSWNNFLFVELVLTINRSYLDLFDADKFDQHSLTQA